MIIKSKWLARFEQLVQIIRDSSKEAKFVGGCVRDTILQSDVSDFDIATDAKPEFVMDILAKAGVKVIPTGLKHGTVTALWNDDPVEITTLRHDLMCDGRHAKVEFTDNWKQDAKRRDFTFNALYLDIEGRVFDYFAGLDDLQQKRLNFVGDAKKRIEEDYLRILRAFRFHARFCKQPIDQEILSACTLYKEKLDQISGERISGEMIKLLSYKPALKELVVMQTCGVLKKVLGFDVRFEKINFASSECIKNPLTKLALLMRNCDLGCDQALFFINKRWKLSKLSYKMLKTLAKNNPSQNAKKNLLYFGAQEAKEMFCILYAEGKIKKEDLDCNITELCSLQKPEFPLRGQDIKNLGYKGVQIGKLMSHLNAVWESTGFKATKSDLLKQIKRHADTNF